MSPQSFRQPSKGGPAPVIDVYVALLFVSLASLFGGIIFLCLELEKYGWKAAL